MHALDRKLDKQGNNCTAVEGDKQGNNCTAVEGQYYMSPWTGSWINKGIVVQQLKDDTICTPWTGSWINKGHRG